MDEKHGDEKLKVCVVGCGDMGTAHATGWAASDQAEIVAFADPDQTRARALAGEHGGVPVFREYREAAGSPDVDVVSVCVPAAMHTEVAVYAFEHGKHVLCEKPVALSIEDADRIADAASSADRRLAVGFQRRFSDTTRVVGELISSNDLGRPLMWRVHMWAPIRTVRNKPAMHDLRHGNGGPFVDMVCHTFDLWRRLFGADPVTVTARGFTFAKGKPELAEVEELAPDTGVVLVEHASGDLGIFSISWGLPPGVAPGGNEDILGPRGAVVIGGAKVTFDNGSDRREWDLAGSGEKTLEIAAFVEVVQGGVPRIAPAGIDDGRIALQTSLAALQSMRSGESVAI